jgi:hypothetical protein
MGRQNLKTCYEKLKNLKDQSKGATTLGKMTLGIATFGIMGLFATLSINDIQHYSKLLYAECRYPECRYSECRSANQDTFQLLNGAFKLSDLSYFKSP